MGMKKMSKYIFSLLILLSCPGLKAQKQEWNGLLVGVDLSRFAVPFIDTTRYGWEFSGSYEIISDLSLVADIGSETTDLSTSLYEYKSAGGYTRLGVEYNFMKHVDKGSRDKMLVGLRYGFTTFYHQADNIQIKDNLWGDFSGGRIDRTWLAANWIELTTGMRARLFNNFYLGWTVQMRIKLGITNDPLMYPYAIPGFGKPWNNTCVGINYSLYYKIPIYKKKKLTEAKPQPPEK
jgi:hypothetical protein